MDLKKKKMEVNNASLLQSYFDFLYAKELSEKMYSVFRKKCLACQDCRLSQWEHTCLTLSDEQQLEVYFEDVLREVQELDILVKWDQAASALDIPAGEIELFKLKIFCKDWRDTNMKTFKWRTKMIKMIVEIRLLERSFK